MAGQAKREPATQGHAHCASTATTKLIEMALGGRVEPGHDDEGGAARDKENVMTSLISTIATLWGWRSPDVAHAYRAAFAAHPLLETDLAIFCNAGAPITGATEFDRGVEEGKRRVWLHIARMRGLKPEDFVSIADGERL
jgi:hypothetical protein